MTRPPYLDDLTPEELAILNEPDENGNLATDGISGIEAAPTPAPETTPAPAPVADAETETPVAEAPVVETPVAEEPAPVIPLAPLPVIPERPEGSLETVTEKINAIASARADIDIQVSNFDLTEAEAAQKRAAFDRDLNALQVQQTKIAAWEGAYAGIEAQQAERQAAFDAAEAQKQGAFFGTSVPQFLRDNPQYDATANPMLYKMLDNALRDRQTEALNSGQSQFDPALLAKAHGDIQAAIGNPAPTPTPTPTPVLKKGMTLAEERAAAWPPNIGTLPTSQIEGTGNPVFTTLDRLASTDPERFQEEMSKLSHDMRNDYLQH